MERKISFSEEEMYHVYNRGVEKRNIFFEADDYERMSLLLYLCNSKTPVNVGVYVRRGLTYSDLWELDVDKQIVEIGAWCLMPNHFHLLLREIKEGGISQFMLKITTAYSMYFNKKNDRVGSLMQGPFKAQHIDNDRHLQYLFSYIHLNPINLIAGESNWKKRGIKDILKVEKFLDKYEYSSLQDYTRHRERPKSKLLNRDAFPWKFESVAQSQGELTDWLEQG